MSETIGIDVGGTKMAGGVVTPDGRVIAEARRDTPAQDALATVDAIVDLVKELTPGHDVEAIGIGAAGFVDADRATVMFAPNLAWRNEPLRKAVQDEVGLPVFVENDVNAAAWGEFRFGAGADVDDLLMVALGTGVGGGIVVEGQMMRGSFGVAGEIGHIRVVPNGHLCGCGQHGCLEQYASGRALVREARNRASAGSALLEAAGGDPNAIRGSMITLAAQQGDPLSMALFAEAGRWLGEGVASLAAVLDPRVVVVGGGVADAGPLLMGPTEEAFDSHLPAGANRPRLEFRLATLGNEAGMVGAADLARGGH